MLSDLGQKILSHDLVKLLLQSELSIQKTMALVAVKGQTATLTGHCTLPDIAENHYIKPGPTAAQLNLTTDFFTEAEAAYQQLKALDSVVAQNIPQDTVIWPTSCLPEKIKQPQNYNTPSSAAQIKIRFKLPQQLLQQLYQADGQKNYSTFVAFKNDVYAYLARNLYQELYLLIYYFGATPTALTSKATAQRSALQNRRYLNFEAFKDFPTYLATLKRAATQVVPVALDAPIFLRPHTGDPEFRQGVQYLQLNVFDLQPNQADGLFAYQLQLIQLYLLHALLAEPATSQTLSQQNERFFQFAGEAPDQQDTDLTAIKNGLIHLKASNDQYLKQASYAEVLQKLLLQLETKTPTTAAQLFTESQQSDAYTYGLQVAQKNKTMLLGTDYQLRGYTDQTLATQQFLKSSLKYGVQYRFLNPQNETLQLCKKGQQTLLTCGGQTPKNTIVLQSILKDPVTLAQLLAQRKVALAQTFVTSDLTEAKRYFETYFQNQPFLLRPQTSSEPKATRIFTEVPTLATFVTAFLEATNYDEQVVLQAWTAASVYGFYILDQQVLSIIEKVPANVVGDGHSTIADLVMQKNDDPRRGHLGQKPLLTLELDAESLQYLKTQHLTPESVPERGIQVFLNQQTAIQAGADGFVVSDEVDDSYQSLALDIAQSLQLHQGSIDMVIPNIYQPYVPFKNRAVVTDISVTPDLVAHSFPFMGPAQDIASLVLKDLLPTIKGH